jgi:hypothetical protein
VIGNATDTFAAALGLLAARHHLGGTALEDQINDMTEAEVRAALLAQTIVAGLLLQACCTHDGIDVTTALTTMGLHNQTITSTKGDTP